MIQKQTVLVPSDKSGVWLVRVIHTYSKLSKSLMPNGFAKISVVSNNTGSWLQKKKKKKTLYTRPGLVVYRACGSALSTNRSSLLLKKRLTPVGRRVVGFCVREVTRKRAISSFIRIL